VVQKASIEHLTIHSDGSCNFTGHLHDSGAEEFNTALVWLVKDSNKG
jgi:hypothetical protein